MENLSLAFRDWAHGSNALGTNRIPEEYDGVCIPRDIHTVHMIDNDRLRIDWLNGSGGVSREQKMLKGHLPRVIYHQIQ